METPGALVEARVPSVSVPVCVVTSVVPVCVVSTCVYTSVAKCVLRRTHRARERRCVQGATSVSVPPCLDETPSASPCVDEPPSTSETPCASGVVAGVPACVLPGTPCVEGAPQPETARVCEARCANETPRVSAPVGVRGGVCVYEARVSERPCVRVTACVRSLYTREMSVAMYEHAAASPDVSTNGMMCSLSLVASGSVSARVAW